MDGQKSWFDKKWAALRDDEQETVLVQVYAGILIWDRMVQKEEQEDKKRFAIKRRAKFDEWYRKLQDGSWAEKELAFAEYKESALPKQTVAK